MTNDEKPDKSNYSVLMSVYAKEKASYLKTAMDSIWSQTVQTDDFVLVCDGALTDELNAVIEEMLERHANELHVIRLPECGGLGNALNIGIKECRHELVARMDSDDISCPDRCQRQMEIFKEHPEYSIVSGSVMEFEAGQPSKMMRQLPQYHKDILKFAKSRNPFNHPCVMYKKSAVEAAGGYRDFFLLEDYYLWLRMLRNGSIGYNIPDCILLMRGGKSLYRRRSGLLYVKTQWKFLKYMKEEGMISLWEYICYGFGRTIVSLIPNHVRQYAFSRFMRKQVK